MAFSSTEFPNPFITARLRLGLTQATLAYRMDISRNMVIRNEQAQFPEPLPSILRWYEDNVYGWDTASAIHEYREFQRSMRAKYGDVLHYGSTTFKHPVKSMLVFSGLSVAGFCRKFCAQQSLMYDLLNNPERFTNYPQWLDEILVESNGIIALEVKEGWAGYVEYLRGIFRGEFGPEELRPQDNGRFVRVTEYHA